jgi:hypothetical protein
MQMARWLLLGLMVLGFAMAFVVHSAGLLAIALVAGFAGFVGFLFALAAARVSASARPESTMVGREELSMMRRADPRTATRPRPPGRGDG